MLKGQAGLKLAIDDKLLEARYCSPAHRTAPFSIKRWLPHSKERQIQVPVGCTPQTNPAGGTVCVQLRRKQMNRVDSSKLVSPSSKKTLK